jgi:hypothetical protein
LGLGGKRAAARQRDGGKCDNSGIHASQDSDGGVSDVYVPIPKLVLVTGVAVVLVVMSAVGMIRARSPRAKTFRLDSVVPSPQQFGAELGERNNDPVANRSGTRRQMRGHEEAIEDDGVFVW